MIIELYHGTNKKNADLIIKQGFKDRGESKKSNWSEEIKSQKGFTYLTRVYPFFYAMNASANQKIASVIKVKVDTDNLFPDEDFLKQAFKKMNKTFDIERYQFLGENSLTYLGNVAIRPEDIIEVVGRKDFDPTEMWQYSDPSMTVMNYKLLGAYYKALTDNWWNDKDYKNLSMTEFMTGSMK